MGDKRFLLRRRVLKGGTIELKGGGRVECILRNVSNTGAAIEVETPLGIPEHFNLLAGGSSRPCRVVWRKQKRIGVTFDPVPT
jgi:PilZ domain-containing protein